MPEHAAVDTSIFNELIPQALQQTLYTKKKSQMYKRQKASLASSPLTSIYIWGVGKSTCNGWDGFHSLLNQFNKIGNQMTFREHIHKATGNPWESKL